MIPSDIKQKIKSNMRTKKRKYKNRKKISLKIFTISVCIKLISIIINSINLLLVQSNLQIHLFTSKI